MRAPFGVVVSFIPLVFLLVIAVFGQKKE